MAQTVTITLMGPDCARIFEVSATDAAYTEVTSKTGALSLQDCMRGKKITHFRAEHASSGQFFRIRNTTTQKIKCIELGDQLGETRTRKIHKPFTVEDNDILENYCNVA